MGKSRLIFLVFVSTIQYLFAQEKIAGKYYSDARYFKPTDTNIITQQFGDAQLAPFMIKDRAPNFLENARVGFMDTTGHIVVKPEYINCSPFKEKYALVQSPGDYKVGIIDQEGKIVVPLIYDGVAIYTNGLFEVSKDKQVGIISADGKFIVPLGKYDSFSHPIQWYSMPGDDIVWYHWELRFLVTKNFNKYIGAGVGNKWHIIDNKGRQVLSPEFDYIGPFKDDKVAIAQIGKKWGAISPSGKIAIPAIYDRITLENGKFACVTLNGKMGVVSLSNKIVIPIMHEYVEQIAATEFLVKDKIANQDLWDNYGIINSKNQIIIAIENHSIKPFGNGYIVENSNIESALYTAMGKRLSLFGRPSPHQFPVWKNDDKGYFVQNVKSGTFNYYDEIYDFTTSLHGYRYLFYYRNEKMGMMDTLGNEITLPIYDDIEYLQDNYFTIKQGNKVGLSNGAGKIIYPCIYSDIYYADEKIVTIP